MKKKILIGITGGIGSGKSLVSDFIETKSFKVIRADLIAKELMLADEKIKRQIKKSFGEEAYNKNQLNAKYLADKIFSSKENNNIINSIVHPPVIKKIKELSLNEFKKNNIVFVESALIYKAEMEDLLDYIILIFTDEDERIKRTVKRDKVEKEKVLQRIKLQIPDQKLKEKADFVIENNSTENQLYERVNFILQILTSLSK